MIELNKIYNENSLFTMSTRMPDNILDLTVTSPPYDKLRTYNGFKFQFKHIARHLFRVTKSGGVLVWVVGDATVNGSETGTSFSQALFFKECGFRLHDTMIYRKKNFIPKNHNRYDNEFEFMFVFTKGRPKTWNPIMIKTIGAGVKSNLKRKGYGFRNGSFRRRDEDVIVNEERIAGNIFSYPTGASGLNHPAVFPEQLAADQIKTWSNEGDLIYDPFAGSGTTLKMAILQNRQWLGSEISKEYCELAEKRIAPFLQQTNLFHQ